MMAWNFQDIFLSVGPFGNNDDDSCPQQLFQENFFEGKLFDVAGETFCVVGYKSADDSAVDPMMDRQTYTSNKKNCEITVFYFLLDMSRMHYFLLGNEIGRLLSEGILNCDTL